MGVSIPFSSGWSLQSFAPVVIAFNPALFQFPFHRDGHCNIIFIGEYNATQGSFNSLFVGMVIAI
jgi:hypothetical protein